jgi:predicted methyltransferase
MVNSNWFGDLLAIGLISFFTIGLMRALAEGTQPTPSQESEMKALQREGLVKRTNGKWKLTSKGRRAVREYDS